VLRLNVSFPMIVTANTGTGDAVPLWNWNIVEASVTVTCACLFASKPVVMLLIPDKLIARLGSQSRSWARHQRNKVIHARSGRSKVSLGSSPHPGSASLCTFQSHPHQAVRYDLEGYGGDSGGHTFLDDYEVITEPAPTMIRK